MLSCKCSNELLKCRPRKFYTKLVQKIHIRRAYVSSFIMCHLLWKRTSFPDLFPPFKRKLPRRPVKKKLEAWELTKDGTEMSVGGHWKKRSIFRQVGHKKSTMSFTFRHHRTNTTNRTITTTNFPTYHRTNRTITVINYPTPCTIITTTQYPIASTITTTKSLTSQPPSPQSPHTPQRTQESIQDLTPPMTRKKLDVKRKAL